MKNKVFNIISLICNVVMIILVIYSVSCFFVKTGEGNMPVLGAACFRYFTIDSNILGAICCAIIIPYNIMTIAGKTEKISKWASIVKLVGTTAVAVTLLTVACFLGPLQGYSGMFSGNNLFLHLICPLLAIISYVGFEKSGKTKWTCSLFGILPTFVYGLVYLVMVIFIGTEKGGWVDFYNFNINGMWYISVVAMLVATAGISMGLFFLKKLITKDYKKTKKNG